MQKKHPRKRTGMLSRFKKALAKYRDLCYNKREVPSRLFHLMTGGTKMK